MSFPFKHILIVGATSGIGRAMADKLIAEGIHVTAVGRRQDRLDAFEHPTVDAIFLNAGMQRHFNFADPANVNLSHFYEEMTTNFTASVALTHAFLPHLLASANPTALIYTGTHISLVPAYRMPAYSASKAALDAFIQCIREQLRDTKVNILHVSPPLVQTEIHDYEIGAERGRKMGMPVEQFVEETWAELKAGKKDVYIGTIAASTKEQIMEIADKRAEAMGRLNELIRNFQ
ncbi:NAD(P)-binding protein [Bimuria novae-zelandiae CBS 107.79]|uniref:NAD(P)-binding protein n=1 Tax=Bimuria novae-zelandiae CBS 107.79 TaxID=1447943 RepID=A0A6A5V9T7_9PLEO|nr:NAD(P)-binding protein [Bimuria novae-zelandiae CBS 107.79]